MDIYRFAKENNASVIKDRDGDIALLRRMWTDDGREIVRHSPDPVDFKSLAWWIGATDEQRREAIC